MKELKEKLQGLLKQARDIAAKAEAENRDFSTEERTEVARLLDEAKGVKTEIDKLVGDDQLRKEIGDLGADIGIVDPADKPEPGKAGKGRTTGERFVKSAEFVQWLKAVAPNGHIPDQAKGLISPPVTIGDLKHFGLDVGRFNGKGIVIGGDEASGGALVLPDQKPFVPLPFRPLVVRDMITRGTTGSDTVQFAREVSRTNAAAVVPEASGTSAGDQGGDVVGAKPESSFVLERVSEPVKTIAHWIPATKRALSDAGQIRTLIDNFLQNGLEEELEDQMITGNGIGENFTGLANTSGVQAQPWDTNLLTTLRKAKTKVRVIGRARANAYLLHPNDAERLDLLTDDNGRFYFGGPAADGVQGVWRLPTVESEAVPEGTGYVGDFTQMVLWDREQASIQVSDSHADFFIRNMVAILAELRAAFGILRPAAFVEIDLTVGS